MSVDISLVAANLRLDAIAAAAGNAARLRIYSGTRPASVAAAITGTLLAELVCGTPFAPAASGGQLKVAAISDDVSADANGTATHFRLFKADGTTGVLDGSVGAHGDLTADLTVGDVVFVAGTPVQIASWRISASGYRWWDNATLFDFDPFNGRGVVDKVPSLPGGMTVTARSGEARQASANGVWQKFVSNVLSLTNDIGAGIFGAFTNKIRNPRGEGGVVGTVGVQNKCTGYNAAPPALVTPTALAAFNSAVTNVYGSGGDGATLFGVVDGTAGLQAIAASDAFIAAGLANGWHNGRVIEVDNTSGAATAYLVLNGPTANTNTHSFSLYGSAIVGTGALRFNSVDYTTITGAPFARYKKEALTPIDGSRLASVAVYAGAKIRITLFSLTEAATAAPVPTVVAGASATGALPTNWAVLNPLGLAACFLGSGIENGLPYADVRVLGTASSTGSFRLSFDNATNAAASAGQAWGQNLWVKAIAGTQVPIVCPIYEYAGGSIGNALAVSAAITPSAAIQLISSKGVASTSTTTGVRLAPIISVTNATAYDFTVRLYAPELVQLAAIEGAEVSADTAFSSPGSWSIAGTGWSVSGGKLNASSVSVGSSATQIVPATESGAVYKIAYTIESVTAAGGGCQGRVGTVSAGAQSTPGTYTSYVVSTGSATINIASAGAGGFSGVIDNFSVKLVTPGYMPAFPILPPVGTPGDSAHNGDVVKAVASGGDPFAGAAAAGIASGMSLAGIETISHIGDGVVRPLAEMSDGTTNNRLRVFIDTDDKLTAAVVSGGVTLATAKLASALTAGELVWAANFDPVNGLYLVRKTGLQNASAALGALPAGLSEFRIGSSVSGNFMNDTKKRQQVRRLMTASEANAWVAAA